MSPHQNVRIGLKRPEILRKKFNVEFCFHCHLLFKFYIKNILKLVNFLFLVYYQDFKKPFLSNFCVYES